MGTLLARMHWLNFLRYCGEHSIVIYLAFFLPMAVTRTLLLKTGLIPDIGVISLIVTVARRRRCGGDLAAGAGAARRLPVRAPRRVLDRAEEGARRRCSRRSRLSLVSCSPRWSAAQSEKSRDQRRIPDFRCAPSGATTLSPMTTGVYWAQNHPPRAVNPRKNP